MNSSTILPFSEVFADKGALPDLKVTSSDATDFYIHSGALLEASDNAFDNKISGQPPYADLDLPETAAVLDIVFRVIYAMSCLTYQPAPSLETSESAINALIKYGVSIPPRADPTSPLGQLILLYAPARALDAYALAAHHNLEPLAAALSAHLLSYDVGLVPDALATKMGAIYFRRLFALQRVRLAALRGIVLRAPARHPATPACDEQAQRQIDRAWAFTTADIVWNAVAGMSVQELSSALERTSAGLACRDCRAMIHDRIEEVVTEWSAVKTTI